MTTSNQRKFVFNTNSNIRTSTNQHASFKPAQQIREQQIQRLLQEQQRSRAHQLLKEQTEKEEQAKKERRFREAQEQQRKQQEAERRQLEYEQQALQRRQGERLQEMRANPNYMARQAILKQDQQRRHERAEQERKDSEERAAVDRAAFDKSKKELLRQYRLAIQPQPQFVATPEQQVQIDKRRNEMAELYVGQQRQRQLSSAATPATMVLQDDHLVSPTADDNDNSLDFEARKAHLRFSYLQARTAVANCEKTALHHGQAVAFMEID